LRTTTSTAAALPGWPKREAVDSLAVAPTGPTVYLEGISGRSHRPNGQFVVPVESP
jgi:hypothetical protein